ncbi:unnamed protein product, partial [Heterotrigona itama]
TFVAILATVAFAIAALPQCPQKNGQDVTLLPNPDDCSTFYYCDEGVPYLTKCSKGLEYDPKLRICDYPKENADCKRYPPTPPRSPSNPACGCSNKTTTQSCGCIPEITTP